MELMLVFALAVTSDV